MCPASINVIFAQEAIDITGTYSIHVGGYDWGCATDKVTLTLNNPIDHVDENTFKVVENSETFDYSKGPAGTIIKAEPTERTVKSVKVDGNTIELDLKVRADTGSPIVWSLATQYNTYVKDYSLEITSNDTQMTSNNQVVNSLTIQKEYTSKTTSADVFDLDNYQAKDGVKYSYASYTPATKSDTLVVWLHGLGEGGKDANTIADRTTDPYVTTLANKVTSLTSDEFQNTVGGANILVPQCPTYWMDKDGKQGNFNNASIEADGTSYYQESLHELIASYKEKVGAKKVVLAGCSNGGYMALLMGLAYPKEYDAIVPICEALPDKYISDEKLQGVKDLPMYFIYSKDDETVTPTLHEIPTIKRLKALGATNLHVSTTEHVVDTSGIYKDENYNGHWSWIYFFNNEAKCDECGVKPFDWIAQQLKDTPTPVINNDKKAETTKTDTQTKAVKTGDNSNMNMYLGIMSFAALGYVFLKRKTA